MGDKVDVCVFGALFQALVDGNSGQGFNIVFSRGPIIDKRWTQRRKQALQSSRVELTRDLVTWMAQASKKPKVFISGSAIGYYGNH